jgi:endonuclease-3 related protein
MPTWDASLAAIMAALDEDYGQPAPGGCAAGLDPLPAMVNVLLERAVNPSKAARARDTLADAGLLDPEALAEADLAELEDVLKSNGVTVPLRALAPLQRIAQWIAEWGPMQRGSDLGESLAKVDIESLRAELASLRGVGPGTADALMLHALGRPVYPLDRATYRVLIRHGWLDASAGYDEARAVVEGTSSGDPAALTRLSYWLGRVGTEFCRPSTAKCDRCPLRGFLPEGGPIEPEGFPAGE